MSREKQIEFEMAEMLRIIEEAREDYANDITDHTENEYIREGLLNAGYRKQSVGKWVFNKEKDEFFCSVCNAEPLIDPHFIGIDYGIEILSDFCPWCGAKMKGGAK